MDKQKETIEINVYEILEKIKSYFGFVPKIFQVLAENPSALKAFLDKSEMMMVDESLPTLIKEFVFIGAAAATGSEHCLQTHLDVARELGALDEQLLLAIIIGASVAETTALAQSLRVYEKFKD
jgi:AhpD family alkylhydroperoxidase